MKNIDHYDLLYNHPEKIISRLKTQFQKRIGKKFNENDINKIKDMERKYGSNWVSGRNPSTLILKIFDIFLKEKLKETLDQVLLDEFQFDKYSCFSTSSRDYGFKFRKIDINDKTSLSQMFTNSGYIGFLKLKISKGNDFRFFDTDIKFINFLETDIYNHGVFFKNVFKKYISSNTNNTGDPFFYPFADYLYQDLCETIVEYLHSKEIDTRFLEFEPKWRYGSFVRYDILLDLSSIDDVFEEIYIKEKKRKFFHIYNTYLEFNIGEIYLKKNLEIIVMDILDNFGKFKEWLFQCDFNIETFTFLKKMEEFTTDNEFRKNLSLDSREITELPLVYDHAVEDIRLLNEEFIKPVCKMLEYLNDDNSELSNLLNDKMKKRAHHCFKHYYTFYRPYRNMYKKYLYTPDFSIGDFMSVCKFKYNNMMENNNVFADLIILENSRRNV